MNKTYNTQPARLASLALVILAAGFARLPQASHEEREALAGQFAFDAMRLPVVGEIPARLDVATHPHIDHISQWAGSLGAGASFADLDEDGIYNDLCVTEPRQRSVQIVPAPGSEGRYTPFAFDLSKHLDAATDIPISCRVSDFNEDGLDDLVVVFFSRSPLLLLRRSPEVPPTSWAPREADFAVQELLPGGSEVWHSVTANTADIDGDGHLDLTVANYFIDGSPMFDANAEGSIELQDSMSRAANGGHNRLYRWVGATSGPHPTVRFEEVPDAFTEEQARRWTLAMGAADLDRNGLVDLYFANDFGPDTLLMNYSTPGKVKFESILGERDIFTPESKTLGHDSFKGMGVDFADLNGDQRFDFMVSNIAAEWRIEESHYLWMSTPEAQAKTFKTAPYRDLSEPMGVSRSDWGWGVRLQDFDNDGTHEAVQATGFVKGEVDMWPQLQEWSMGNDELIKRPEAWMRVKLGDDVSGDEPNAFYARTADGQFFDITADLGIDEPLVTRGIALADSDADGDMDMVWSVQWDDSVFLRNEAPDPGAFVGLHVLLPPQGVSRSTSVRTAPPTSPADGWPAAGATAVLHTPEGKQLLAQVDTNTGHTGGRARAIHFGVGDLPEDTTFDLDLTWRDGDGALHNERLQVSSGWQTVLLGGN